MAPRPWLLACGQNGARPVWPATGGLAEREGFEPSDEFYPINRLAGGCLRPLGHLSGDRPGAPGPSLPGRASRSMACILSGFASRRQPKRGQEPAGAGAGPSDGLGWRRGRDSNPRPLRVAVFKNPWRLRADLAPARSLSPKRASLGALRGLSPTAVVSVREYKRHGASGATGT